MSRRQLPEHRIHKFPPERTASIEHVAPPELQNAGAELIATIGYLNAFFLKIHSIFPAQRGILRRDTDRVLPLSEYLRQTRSYDEIIRQLNDNGLTLATIEDNYQAMALALDAFADRCSMTSPDGLGYFENKLGLNLEPNNYIIEFNKQSFFDICRIISQITEKLEDLLQAYLVNILEPFGTANQKLAALYAELNAAEQAAYQRYSKLKTKCQI